MSKRHYWVGPAGEDWTPEAKSDDCAQCGSTPDVHPVRPHDWATDEARQLLALLGPSYIAPYNTRKRREREIASRIMTIVALHRNDYPFGEPSRG